MAVVGRIARPHGIRGQVVVNAESDFLEDRYQPGAEFFTKRGDTVSTITLTSVRFHRGRPIVGLDGVDTMTEAEGWAGIELRIPREQLAPLPDGVFYNHDLVGCLVVTRDGAEIGTVRDVEGGLGGSRLVIDGGAQGEILLPLAEVMCPVIDVAGKRIVANPPEGLLDLNVKAH